jgi:lipopolysaccharide transport system ATP-binding protein
MGKVAGEGRTVLFVSHNMAAVQHLCDRVLLLNRGSLECQGSPENTVLKYLQKPRNELDSYNPVVGSNGIGGFRPSWAKPWIVSARLLGPDKQPRDTFPLSSDIVIEMSFQSPDNTFLASPVMGVVISHSIFGEVGGINTRMTGFWNHGKFDCGTMYCHIKRPPLLQGLYYIDLWLGDGPSDIDSLQQCLAFHIVPSDVYGSGQLPFAKLGVIFLEATWDFKCGIS